MGTWNNGTAEQWRNIWNTTKQRNRRTPAEQRNNKAIPRNITNSERRHIERFFSLYCFSFPITVQLYTRNPTINPRTLWFCCAGVFYWCYVSVWLVFQGVSLLLRGVPLFRRCFAVLPVFCIQYFDGVKLFQWYSMFRCSLLQRSWFYSMPFKANYFYILLYKLVQLRFYKTQ